MEIQIHHAETFSMLLDMEYTGQYVLFADQLVCFWGKQHKTKQKPLLCIHILDTERPSYAAAVCALPSTAQPSLPPLSLIISYVRATAPQSFTGS